VSARETLTWKGAAPMAVALSLLVLTGTAWPPGLAAALERLVAVMGG
jgi:CBS-domain-containing membrane protein